MRKILATPRSFGKTDPAPIRLLEEAGFEVTMNPAGAILTEEEMKLHLAGAEGVIVGVDPLSAAVLAAAPKLRAIAKYGVGTDNIDLDAARELGIPVSVTPGANTDAVADFAFTLMAACARNLTAIDRRCRQGDWGKITSLDIGKKTLGILGLGAVGKALARRARGFDMEILAYDLFWDEAHARDHKIDFAEVDHILRRADFISVHLPLTPDTRHMISEREFGMMKKTAVLVNTARGGIIDEAALARALSERRIHGAGLDVFAEEPPTDPALYGLDNLIMGSHCAASTVGAVENMGLLAARNILRDLGAA